MNKNSKILVSIIAALAIAFGLYAYTDSKRVFTSFDTKVTFTVGFSDVTRQTLLKDFTDDELSDILANNVNKLQKAEAKGKSDKLIAELEEQGFFVIKRDLDFIEYSDELKEALKDQNPDEVEAFIIEKSKEMLDQGLEPNSQDINTALEDEYLNK